jgi:hypothetical protein
MCSLYSFHEISIGWMISNINQIIRVGPNRGLVIEEVRQ